MISFPTAQMTRLSIEGILRIWPRSTAIHTQNTMAFVFRNAYVPTSSLGATLRIEGQTIDPFIGDPSDNNYRKTGPNYGPLVLKLLLNEV